MHRKQYHAIHENMFIELMFGKSIAIIISITNLEGNDVWITYCKIPKISPGAYIFQRPFLRGLFLEGPIFGGAYLRREICVSKSIGLAL